jgi:hypothetical protein
VSLKESIFVASRAAIKRETITLPVAGVAVQVRSMMTGEVQRISNAAAEKQGVVEIALATEDPATGDLIWNVNDLADRTAIEGLALADSTAILELANRLSYIGTENEEKGKENFSEEEKSSSIS